MYGILLHISLFVFGAIVLSGPGSLIHKVSRSHTTPLDEWSTRHRDLYLTTHNTHNIQTSTLQHTTLTTYRPLTYNSQHSQHTDLYLTTHNTHNIQTSILQHTTLITYRPLPYNTQHSQHTDIYITTHNTHNIQTTKPQLRFETTISASVRPQTHVLDSAASDTGIITHLNIRYIYI